MINIFMTEVFLLTLLNAETGYLYHVKSSKTFSHPGYTGKPILQILKNWFKNFDYMLTLIEN